MHRIAAVLNLLTQLNKYSSNNLIRHGTKTVSVADVFLFYLTVTLHILYVKGRRKRWFFGKPLGRSELP